MENLQALVPATIHYLTKKESHVAYVELDQKKSVKKTVNELNTSPLTLSISPDSHWQYNEQNKQLYPIQGELQ